MRRQRREAEVACPQCNTRLGGWGLVLVHDIYYSRWFYRCSCGWHSTMHKTERALINACAALAASTKRKPTGRGRGK